MLVVGGGCWCALSACVQSGIFRKCWFNVQIRCENWKNIVMLLSNANNSALHKTTTTKSSASARTIQIDWCRDYYSFKCPSNKGTQFGSIGEHLEWNNGSRIAGDGFFFLQRNRSGNKSRNTNKNNTIQHSRVVVKFNVGADSTRVDEQKGAKLYANLIHMENSFTCWLFTQSSKMSSPCGPMRVIVITVQSTSSNTTDTYNPRGGGWSAKTTARPY